MGKCARAYIVAQEHGQWSFVTKSHKVMTINLDWYINKLVRWCKSKGVKDIVII